MILLRIIVQTNEIYSDYCVDQFTRGMSVLLTE